MRHIGHMKYQDAACNMPIESTGREIPDDLLEPRSPFMNSVNKIMSRNLAHDKIIDFVESIDPITPYVEPFIHCHEIRGDKGSFH